MAAHRLGLLVAPLAVVALAGCGSAHKSRAAAPPVDSGAASTVPSQTGTVRSPSASVRNGAARTCKADIASQSKLSAGSRQALDAICAAAAATNATAVHGEEAEACRALVKSTVPLAYQRAELASCAKP